MGTLTLTDPTNGTTADATLIASNNSAIKTVVNGGLDNTNIAVGAAIDPAKISGGVASVPTATVVPYAAASAPSGWLLCDGSAVSRTTYATLFGVISTTYGIGDGSTTFNVPNTLGRMVAGYAASGHADVATLGNNDGVALANRRPKHNSTVTDPGHTHTLETNPGTTVSIAVSGGDTGYIVEPGNSTSGLVDSHTTGVTVGPGGTAVVDAPAYLVLNYIIKT